MVGCKSFASLASGLLVLAVWVPLLEGTTPAHAEPVAGDHSVVQRLLGSLDRLLVPRCLTPDAGHRLEDFVASGALQPVLRDRFTLARIDLRASEIEVELEDELHHAYVISLILPESKSDKPDGQGRSFVFYLKPSAAPPNADANTALLAVASLFDQAIPESALMGCSGGSHEAQAEVSRDRRYPRVLALGSAMAEVAVLLAATLFGLRAIGSRDG